MLRLKNRLFLILAVFMFALTGAHATHIVGGDLTYTHIKDHFYEVTLTLRIDCELGDPEAGFDDPAKIAVLDAYGNVLHQFGPEGFLLVPFTGSEIVESELGDCGIVGEEVCVQQTVYKDTVCFPDRNGGYWLSYQRCCRNSSLNNIVDPLETGSNFYIRITEPALTPEAYNSSPIFNEWPDLYACVNEALLFDHSATDPDGDELKYRLVTPKAGATFDEPIPFFPDPPPWEDVVWQAPFNESDMMGGPVPLTIDENTGFLTATPGIIGQYVIGVAVDEYRDAQLISTVIRNFEYNVRECQDRPMADFEAPELQCDGLTVEFTNTSVFADSYLWCFDYPDLNSPTSEEENPVYTFPANGIYQVKLTAIRDSDGCSNTIIKEIAVYDSHLFADFDFAPTECTDDSLTFTLTSTSEEPDPLFEIVSTVWVVNGTDTLEGTEVSVTVPKVEDNMVSLTVTSGNGCTADTSKVLEIDIVELSFVADPIDLCVGDETSLVSNPNSAWTYTWEPEEGLTFESEDDKSDPTASPLDTTTYNVTVTDGLCTETGSVTVNVRQRLQVMLDGDTLTCDGNISLIGSNGDVGAVYEWGINTDFDPVLFEGEVFDATITGDEQTFYVRVKEGTGCAMGIDSITVINGTIDITAATSLSLCIGDTTTYEIINNKEHHTLTILWTEDGHIIGDLDAAIQTIIAGEEAGNFDLSFTVTNQYGCTEDVSIALEVVAPPELAFSYEHMCGTFQVCFENMTIPEMDSIAWDFGDETTDEDVSTEDKPCYDYPGPGTYTVTLTGTMEPCAGVFLTMEVIVPDTISLTAEPETLTYCFGDEVTLSSSANVENVDFTWCDADGVEIGTGPSITIKPVGDVIIFAKGTDEFGCSDTTSVSLTEYTFSVEASFPEIVCPGVEDSIVITDLAGDNLSYNWEPKECITGGDDTSSPTISATSTKDFTVTITNNDFGCDTSITITINVSTISVTAELDPNHPTDCIFLGTPFNVIANTTGNIVDYTWSTGESGPGESTIVKQPETSGTFSYTVTVTDEFGCTAESTISAIVPEVQCAEDVFLPTAFSPNGDDLNDVLFVRSNVISDVELYIYNRWGQEVFFTNNIDFGWDGTFDRKEVEPDVFGYHLTVTCTDGNTVTKQGNITLLR
jgi:gliding motility-associated-like protein